MSTPELNVVTERVRKFLRDNQILKISVKYSEEVVNRLQKRKGWIKKVQNHYSQYGVFIAFDAGVKDEVKVRGTGFGVARVLSDLQHVVNGTGQLDEEDEDRFTSDEEER